jgi:uncharacterized protein
MNRRRFLSIAKKSLVGGILAGPLCYAYGSFYGRHQINVEENELPIRGLGEAWRGVRVVQLSDLHLEPFTTAADINQAVALANSLKPDFVVITGDFVTKDPRTSIRLGELLKELHAPLGVHGCLGNHDHWVDANFVQRELERNGIQILRNQSMLLEQNGAKLCLAGVDSAWQGKPDLRKALLQNRAQAPVLLLAHEPDYVLHHPPDCNVAAQLSGHTHGGQVRVPGFSPPYLPAMGRRFAAGAYRAGATELYVNRGIGCIGLPVRFAAPPEVTLHILKPISA